MTPLLGDLFPPDPALVAIYDQAFPTYVAARKVMPPIWADLAAIRNGATA